MILVVIIFCTAAYKIVSSGVEDKKYYEAFSKNYKIFNVEIPETIDFAGEIVPLDTFYTRESLERELLVNVYWNSNTLLMFKRANRYFPIIESILKKNNIPDDFKFVALIESNLENVTSPAGAKGYWQFMKSTATSYGLEISGEVDERLNIEKSTEAACKYFKAAYKKFNNWTLAAASYNMGMSGISGHLDDQKVSNYYDLYLNKETTRYIFRILAVKSIFLKPVKYGYYIRHKDLYPPIPTTVLEIDSTIVSLPSFALENKINYRILKELNPWLLNFSLTVKDGKTYSILIPKVGYTNYKMLDKLFEDPNKIFHDTLKIQNVE